MSELKLDDIIDLIAQANELGVRIALDNDDLVVQVPESNKVDPFFFSALKANKKRLKEYFKKYQADQQDKASVTAIRPLDNMSTDRVPLSFAQERLWFIDKLQGSTQYHIPLLFRLRHHLRVDYLEWSLRDIMRRHEVLRTVIKEDDGKPYQQVLPVDGWCLQFIDYADVFLSKDALHRYIDTLVTQPFDLANDYMLRAWLLRLSGGSYILVMVVHHIAFDGWSVPILTTELADFYVSYQLQREPGLKPLPVQYADYAVWQRSHLTGQLLSRGLDYWKEQLAGVEVLELPHDFSRPAEQGSGGGIVRQTVREPVKQKLEKLCQQQEVTLFMLLLSACKVLLHRYSGQHDICVGCPVAGRRQTEVEGLVGFFVNTLALRSQLNGAMSFEALLQQVKLTTLEAYEHQDVPFEKVVESLGIPRDMSRSPVFQVMFSMQQQSGVKASLGGVALQPEERTVSTQAKFDISFEAINSDLGLEIVMIYSTELYQHHTAQKLLAHYVNLLDAVVTAGTLPVGALPMLSPAEEEEIVSISRGPAIAFDGVQTIVAGFDCQALRTPHQTALYFEEERFTYSQLKEHADLLAGYLVKKGVTHESRVGLFTEPGPWMVIGMLGIMKAGGAYVPIDIDYPADRTSWVLGNAGISQIITTGNLLDKLPAQVTATAIDTNWQAIAEAGAGAALPSIQPHQLAYVLYTSGSTGRPKGVIIEHQSIMNRLQWGQWKWNLHHSDGVLQKTTYCFDISIWEIFWPLMHGSRLVLARRYGGSDPAYLKQVIEKHQLTVVHFVPSLLEVFLHDVEPGDCQSLRHVLCSGEALKPSQVNLFAQKFPAAEIHNLYGPTEASIEVTCWSHKASDGVVESVPIGKPTANTQLYILNEAGSLCAKGVTGELHIGGIQIARGYLNNEELTAKSFVTNKSRLYKTGDLCRWNAHDEIEFLGRKDEQIKLHGYRIELGEVEAVLQEPVGVEQCVVLMISNEVGKRLVAFVAGRRLPAREILLQHAATRLPAYMIPAELVLLEQLPVTRNGKADKPALRQLLANRQQQKGREYTPPRNELEEQLAATWQQLLGVERVGIHDNFFELGGDSIITIQVVSQVRRIGYQLHPRDIFTQQTIARLSALLQVRSKDDAPVGEQGLLTGESGLLPVQQWFLHNDLPKPHFNQSVLIAIEKEVAEPVLANAIKQLVAHHDALRFQYKFENGTWTQWYGTHEGRLETQDLHHPSQLHALGQQWQQSVDFTNGPLFRFVLFRTPETDSHNRLLIIVHHLAVDGVSWRIILEDLGTLVTQSGPATLVPKTTSYRQWHRQLSAFAQSKKLQEERSYWANASGAPLPVDVQHAGTWTLAQMNRVSAKLDAAYTAALLQQVPAAYHTEINDILIAALSATLRQWSSNNKIIIGMEGHGRENIGADADVSRTVGWFTSMYPITIALDDATCTADLIKTVKEQLRRVPNKGIGYGLLRYLNNDPLLQQQQPWEIMFNYMGQVDNVVKKDTGIKGVGESAGNPISDQMPWLNKIEVSAIVVDGKLGLQWNYSTVHFNAATIQLLADNFILTLKNIIDHCKAITHPQPTPADFGLSNELSYRELDKFLDTGNNRVAIERMYRLSGLQEGILFHSLMGGKSGAYTDQMVVDLADLRVSTFIESWNWLLKKFSILRTGFFHDAFKIPVQAVYREVKIAVDEIDLRGIAANEQADFMKAFEQQDIEKGFDLSAAPLMRVSLLQLQDNFFRMIWTHHHLVLDGWSGPLLVDEFMETYRLLLAGRQPVAAAQDQYEDYIRYIESKDKQQEEHYWRNYTSLVAQGSLLPFIKPSAERTKKVAAYNAVTLEIEPGTTRLIQNCARQNHLTVNTIMQGVWAYLLHQYTGNQQVVYGVVVSGRPEDLPGMEKRIGMYINTLPLCTTVDPAEQVIVWLRTLQRQQMESREYQYTSLNTIQDWAGIKGDLFDTTFSYQNFPVSYASANNGNKSNDASTGTRQEPAVHKMNIHEKTSNYPLSLRITERERISIQFIYKNNLLDEACVEMISAHFKHVLLQVTTNITANLSALRLLTPAQTHQLLHEFSGPLVDYGEDVSITEIFRRQAALTPTAIAISFGTTNFSYAELDERSNQLAHLLRSRGVQKETLVPLCAERGLQMVIAILAVLKAGGAYIPIDPAYPAERISYILEDANASLIICSSRHVPVTNAEIIILDDETQYAAYPSHPLKDEPAPDQLCYIIYTSGSTGKPKGVMIEHRGVVNMILNQAAPLGLRQGINVLQFASLGFDASCYEIFGTLLHGGRLVLTSRSTLLDEALLMEVIESNAIELITIPPTYLALISSRNTGIKTVVSAGEQLNEEIARQVMRQGIKLINAYGPTENTVCSTLTETPLMNDGLVSIGKPQANVKVYILNDNLHAVPPGVEAELYLGGKQLARGYWNRPELTTEKFIMHNGERLYRTGDLGYWTSTGEIIFTGRRDEQVKIRGHRVELGEIETVLQQAHGTRQCVVLLKDDQKASRQLVAFVVATDFDKESITRHLKSHLPEYMLPSAIMQVSSIPLTPNGKVDKKQLLSMTVTANHRQPPRNETEEKLHAIWKEVLGVDDVSIHDNFFELGGNSMIILLMLSHCRKLSWQLQIDDLFTCQTIEQQAAFIAQQAKQSSAETISQHLLPLNNAHGKPMVFVIPGMVGQCEAYLDLGGALSTAYQLYGLQMMGTFENEYPLNSLQSIAAQNIEWMRQVQPEGPYRFIAHSFGMYIAFEMIKMLEQEGQAVEFVAALDIEARPVQTPGKLLHDPDWLLGIAGYYLSECKVIKHPAPALVAELKAHLVSLPLEQRVAFIGAYLKERMLPAAENINLACRLLSVRLRNEQVDAAPVGRINAPLLLFKANQGSSKNTDDTWGWAKHANVTRVLEVPGTHLTMFRNGNVQVLAQKLLHIESI